MLEPLSTLESVQEEASLQHRVQLFERELREKQVMDELFPALRCFEYNLLWTAVLYIIVYSI